MTVRILALMAIIFPAGLAQGQWLGGTGASWQVLSLRPLEEENTLNYSGYTFDAFLGYFLFESFEVRLVGSAMKARKGAAMFYEGDIWVQRWSGEAGYWLDNSVYMALDGGLFSFDTPSHHSHNEIVGLWSGTEFGLKLAGTWKARRHQWFELGLRISQVDLISHKDPFTDQRKLDTIALSMTYLLVED